MPQFLTDPSITLRGLRQPESPWDMLTRFAQLQQLQQAGRLNRLSEEEASLRLEQLRRLEGDKSAMRSATAAGVRPGFTMPAGGAGDAALMTDVQVPPRLDRAAMLSELAKGAPHLVPGVQADFAAQEAEKRKAEMEQIAALQKMDDASFKRVKEFSAHVSNEIARLLAIEPQYRPGAWPTLRAQQPEQIQKILPAQYPGDQWLEMQAAGSETAKQILDAEEKRRSPQAAATTTFGGNRYQWNPATKKYDIKLGPDKGEGGGPSQAQRAAAERWKQTQLRTLKADAARRQQAVDRGEPNAEAMSEEEFRNRWQDIQDSYESQLASGQHLNIPGAMARENLPGRGAAPQAEPAAKGKLSLEQAAEYLRRAGGDKQKARAMARTDGWEF